MSIIATIKLCYNLNRSPSELKHVKQQNDPEM